MTRGQKKFLYGLFYAAIAAIIIWALIPSSPKTPVPCSGAHCGASEPLPLRVSGVPQIFVSQSTHRVIALGQVENPNPDYGARNFSYDFLIFDRNGKTISSIPGSGSIYPSETRYVLGVYDAGDADLSSIADRPGLEISGATMSPAADFVKPDIETAGPLSVQIDSSNAVVSGTVENSSSFPAENIAAIAVIENKYGDPLFAAQTLIQSIGGFQKIPLNVQLPADQSLSENTDAGKTRVFFYAE